MKLNKDVMSVRKDTYFQLKIFVKKLIFLFVRKIFYPH